MTIVNDVTVTQYEDVRWSFQADGEGGLIGQADLRLYNADGKIIGTHSIAVPLTSGEETTLLNKFASLRTAFETATSWTLYTGG